jgi:DNA polymerase-3 subunit delta
MARPKGKSAASGGGPAAKPLYPKDFQPLLDGGAVTGAWAFVGGSEEEYREIREAVEKAVVAPGTACFNVSHFNGREASSADIITAARTGGMGGGGRLVILREPRLLPPSDQDLLLAYLKEPDRAGSLLVFDGELDRSSAWYRRLAGTGVLIDYKPPPWAKRADGVKAALARHGLRADGTAMELLVALLPDDKGITNRELEKIALFLGDRRDIRSGDLKDILTAGARVGDFELSNEITRGRRAAAIRLLDRRLEVGEEPLAILGQMARTYRLILTAVECRRRGDEFRTLGEFRRLPRETLSDLERAASRFPREELIGALDRLREIDRLLKSQRLPASFLLELFLAGSLPTADAAVHPIGS